MLNRKRCRKLPLEEQSSSSQRGAKGQEQSKKKREESNSDSKSGEIIGEDSSNENSLHMANS